MEIGNRDWRPEVWQACIVAAAALKDSAERTPEQLMTRAIALYNAALKINPLTV
jgi:hypothetical protein